jgi:hypothetical protein
VPGDVDNQEVEIALAKRVQVTPQLKSTLASLSGVAKSKRCDEPPKLAVGRDGIDLIVFFPASYLAVGALQIYQQSDRSAEITASSSCSSRCRCSALRRLGGVACAAPGQVAGAYRGLFVAPLVYAAFLVAFLMQGA